MSYLPAQLAPVVDGQYFPFSLHQNQLLTFRHDSFFTAERPHHVHAIPENELMDTNKLTAAHGHVNVVMLRVGALGMTADHGFVYRKLEPRCLLQKENSISHNNPKTSMHFSIGTDHVNSLLTGFVIIVTLAPDVRCFRQVRSH
jgi:hypothetical protein